MKSKVPLLRRASASERNDTDFIALDSVGNEFLRISYPLLSSYSHAHNGKSLNIFQFLRRFHPSKARRYLGCVQNANHLYIDHSHYSIADPIKDSQQSAPMLEMEK